MYLPMDAATSGTLSTIALKRPSNMTIARILTADVLIEPFCQCLCDVRVLQGGHCQQNANEKDDRRHINLLERVNQIAPSKAFPSGFYAARARADQCLCGLHV